MKYDCSAWYCMHLVGIYLHHLLKSFLEWLLEQLGREGFIYEVLLNIFRSGRPLQNLLLLAVYQLVRVDSGDRVGYQTFSHHHLVVKALNHHHLVPGTHS